VPEVGAAVQQLFHGHYGHGFMPLLLSVVAQRRVAPSPGVCGMPNPS